MAQRLLERRWPVAVFDIDAAKVAALQALGATPRADAAQAVLGCGILIVCVVDAQQTGDVLFGRRARPQRCAPGRRCCFAPRSRPQDVEDFARRLAERGIAAIDAPMSGGPARARDGIDEPDGGLRGRVFRTPARL